MKKTMWVKVAGGLLALTVLATVFMAYLNPHVVRDLATQFWACF